MRLAFTENDEADETNLAGPAANCISRIIQLLDACIIRHRHSISHLGRSLCGHSINQPPCPHHIAVSQVPVPADLHAALCIVYDRCLSNCRAERVYHVVEDLHRLGNGRPSYCHLANGNLHGQTGLRTTSIAESHLAPMPVLPNIPKSMAFRPV